MNNQSLARWLIPVAIVLSIVYSDRKTPPTWVPYLDTISVKLIVTRFNTTINSKSRTSARYIVNIGDIRWPALGL